MNGIDPDDQAMPFGARLKFYRTRAGKTRDVLGGLIGKSGAWVKAVETGRLQTPRLATLVKLAEALRLRDIADLVGAQALPVEQFQGPGHPALAAVRKAINHLASPDTEPVNLAHLQLRLADAWRLRHASGHHRTALGQVLPGLITDAGAAIATAETTNRAAAYATLAEVMNLAQMFAAYQNDGNLLWRIAERGMMAAETSGDRAAVASAAWFMCQVHRDAGQWDDSADLIDDALAMTEPALADAGTELLSLYGALSFEAAYTAARAGDAGHAWHMWDQAETVAQRLPESHYHRQTSFGRAIIGAHAVTCAVELTQAGTAMRYARHTNPAAIPSNPRRSRHLIEVARAQHATGDLADTLATLSDAQATAPETVRYNGFARTIVLQLLDGPKPLRAEANTLATAVGLVA